MHAKMGSDRLWGCHGRPGRYAGGFILHSGMTDIKIGFGHQSGQQGTDPGLLELSNSVI